MPDRGGARMERPPRSTEGPRLARRPHCFLLAASVQPPCSKAYVPARRLAPVARTEPRAPGETPGETPGDVPASFGTRSMDFDEAFGFSAMATDRDRARFGVRPGMRVLDVGCGHGALTRFLLPALEGDGEVVGVDVDEALLAAARQRTADLNSLNDGVRVRFQRADALDLPFEADAFDAVASQFLLCILPDPHAALAEMVRVARPGATVASLSCFCKSGNLPWFRGAPDWERRDRFEELVGRFYPLYRTTVRNPGLGLPNGRDLEVWAAYRDVGLEELRVKGYLYAYSPSSADTTTGEAMDYLERRARVDVGLLDGLSDLALSTLDEHGLSPKEVEELRDLTEAHYARLRADPELARGSMELFVDPFVLMTGRVPDGA